jgi:mRNA interferase MazF
MPERGDLLLIPFPFTDLSASKRRPVLALTHSDSYGDFIALPVTSRPQHAHGLPIAPNDLVEGLLPAPSWIRTNRIVTLNESLVVKRVGRLSMGSVSAAIECVCLYIKNDSIPP